MKHPATLAAITLLAAFAPMLSAAPVMVDVFGGYAFAVSLIPLLFLAVVATASVLNQSVAALAIRNEDFHWY